MGVSFGSWCVPWLLERIVDPYLSATGSQKSRNWRSWISPNLKQHQADLAKCGAVRALQNNVCRWVKTGHHLVPMSHANTFKLDPVLGLPEKVSSRTSPGNIWKQRITTQKNLANSLVIIGYHNIPFTPVRSTIAALYASWRTL
jgi:hypothetical protein